MNMVWYTVGMGEGCWSVETNNGKHEAWLLLLDNTKSKTLLWWNSKYDVQDVLDRTLAFYKWYYSWEDMEEFAKKEIDAFM